MGLAGTRYRLFAAPAFGEAAVGRCRDAELGAKVLGEGLRPLEPRRRPARPKGLDAGRGEVVDDPGDERALGADDDEADRIVLAECGNGGVIGDVERDICPALSRPRVPRGDEQAVAERTCRETPGKRMFPPARADQKDVHAVSVELEH